MAKTAFATVDQYLAAQPEPARRALERVRGAIRKALPESAESISYQMPAYKLGGRAVIYFAGWKQHYSIYPASAALLKELGAELAPYEVEKGTIRFPLARTVPVRLIERIAKFRATEAAVRQRR